MTSPWKILRERFPHFAAEAGIKWRVNAARKSEEEKDNPGG